jgi:hypothetical protein
MASLPQALPTPVAASPVAHSTEIKEQSAQAADSQTDLTIALPTGVSSASSRSHPSTPEDFSGTAGAAKAVAQETSESDDTLSRPGQLSTVSGSRGLSDLPPNAAESPNAQAEALPPVAMLAEGVDPIESPALGLSPTPILAPNNHPSQAFVQGHAELSIQPGNDTLDVAPASISSDGLTQLSMATSAAVVQSGQLAVAPPSAGKASSAGVEKTATSGKLRSERGAGSLDAVQHGRALAQGQSSVPVVDASAMARDLAGAGGTVSTAGELARASTVTTTGPDTRETFATLDAEGATGKPTWIHAGAQQAEAGFQDPTLGWVSVRADASGGGVHAELVPGSADAAQALGSHMAGLNAYLAEHHTPVETLTLSAPESGWAGMSNNKGGGEGMQQGAGQQTGQETAQNADRDFQSRQSGSPTILPATALELPASFEVLNGRAQAARLVGSHISVMA